MSSAAPTPGGARGYEERDVAFRPIVVTAILLVVLILGAVGLMWVLQRAFLKREAERSAPVSPLAATYGREEPPMPRLQQDPRRDLATLRARDQALLDHYAWVDRAAGTVRIPVERAMELLVAEGRR